MKGWKTWVAAGVAIVAAGLEAQGYGTAAKVLLMVAGALGMVGVAHKIEKAGK